MFRFGVRRVCRGKDLQLHRFAAALRHVMLLHLGTNLDALGSAPLRRGLRLLGCHLVARCFEGLVRGGQLLLKLRKERLASLLLCQPLLPQLRGGFVQIRCLTEHLLDGFRRLNDPGA